MASKAEQIPRRTILKWGLGLGAAAATTSVSLFSFQIGEALESQFIPEVPSSKLDYLLDYERIFVNSPESEQTGIVINAPFVAYDLRPDTPDRFKEKMNSLGTSSARIFIKDGMESEIGTYNEFYVERIKTFIEEVNNAGENEFIFRIPFIDMFRFEHSNRFNPVYGSMPLKHAYLKGAKKPEEIEARQREFYTNPLIIEGFKNRIRYIMNYLQPVSQYIRWEVANEPAILFNTEDKKGVLTEWLSNVLPVITDLDPGKSISAGTADATDYNGAELVKAGLNLASFHTYLKNGKDMRSMLKYTSDMILDPSLPPIYWGEMGSARKAFGIQISQNIHDWSFQTTIEDMFSLNSYVDNENNKLVLPFSNIGIWNLDLDENHDGFEFDPETYKRTAHTLHTIHSLLKH